VNVGHVKGIDTTLDELDELSQRQTISNLKQSLRRALKS